MNRCDEKKQFLSLSNSKDTVTLKKIFLLYPWLTILLQNKNYIVWSTLVILVNHLFSFISITLKFLEKGHTYMKVINGPMVLWVVNFVK